MRDIKFRAWDKRFGMMIYQLPDGYRLAFNGDIQVVGDDLATVKTSNEFILMQYAGLYDSEGWEIYEGDIVDCYHGAYHRVGEVIYIGEPCCGVLASFCSRNKYGFLLLSETPELKVIGTIHTHPELLEKK